jgi:hypothetical protein
MKISLNLSYISNKFHHKKSYKFPQIISFCRIFSGNFAKIQNEWYKLK